MTNAENSSQSNRFYITTAIAYVNAKPHVGFAMEEVQADFLARLARLQQKETFFLTGSDEHGLKIAQTAEKEGLGYQEFTDKYSGFLKELLVKLNISHDHFVRTTDKSHEAFAQEMWLKIQENGDFYKQKYQGLYCVGCEKFLTEKELEDGKCPFHLTEPVASEEENYFFKLSKYQDQIKELIEKDLVKIHPESRKNEVLNFIKDGLNDVSFSRPKDSVKWGLPVPGDENQLMYVWCDALSNYLSAVDRDKFWPANVHVIGKDILRFHAVYWLGMLLSAGYELPADIIVHGFISSNGHKMSKSLGNVVDPIEYIDQYGVDALRYYLCREIPTLGDGDFTKERFEVVYKDELANTFGNLVSRVLAMNKKYFENKIPQMPLESNFKTIFEEGWQDYLNFVQEYDLKKAVETVVKLGFVANKYVEDSKPWELAKQDQLKLAEVMFNLLEMIRQIALMLLPIIPDTAKKILAVYQINTENLLWSEHQSWGNFDQSITLNALEILFPRIMD